MNFKSKKLYFIIAAVIVLVLAAALFITNYYYLELNVSKETITLEYGVDKVSDIQFLRKSILDKEGTPLKTNIEGKINQEKLGTYKVSFVTSYKNKTYSEKRTIKIVDTLPPEIKLVSSKDHYTSPGTEYVEEGFTAIDNHDGDLTDKVVREVKEKVITYTVSDSSGNVAKVKRKIIYKDVVAPTITLNGDAEMRFTIGQDFTDPGFTATDDVDGDMTSAVQVEGTVDGHTKGTYTLTYRATDSSNNVGEVQRIVHVGDFNAPVITLANPGRIYVKVGEAYAEPGYSAVDNIDGDLTSKVVISGGVDTSKMGRNTVTYTITDAAGNTSTASRSVYVYMKQAVANPVNPGNKVVYLTFDDGPFKYTGRLLDILDKYGVKATFFVTNQFPAYQHMIGETHRRGHTIALHTYTHNYANIYSSEDAYYNDLALIHNLCVSQTGVTPTIVRFPGGTNNTVSRSYCSGIMTALSQSLSYHGYLYSDWNVSSGDAGGTTSKDQVVANVIGGIQRNNISIVLQHDIKSFSVEAVDDIIFWGLENGYTFLPMTDTTPMVHYRPQN